METARRRESEAERVYREILTTVVVPILGDKITVGGELDAFGRHMLGKRFRGVFPSDRLPELANGECCIVNTDDSAGPGEHWMSVYRSAGKNILQDSFGRPASEILPSLPEADNADLDAEQHPKEVNCGARSVAWLLLADRFGVKLAKLV